MKYEKKYTAIQIGTKRVDDNITVFLRYGEVSGSFYSEEKPRQIFDTEQEAIEWAYRFDKYARWMVVPVVDFIIE